jgi:hypothetical protein
MTLILVDKWCKIRMKVRMKPKVPKGSRFELRFYEGYKSKETPRAVLFGDREFKIDRVMERKRVRDERTGKTSEVLTCLMEGHRVRIVIHDTGHFELVYL